MKKLLLFAIAATLFAACSKDDETPAPTSNPNIISFEQSEKMVDYKGAALTLGEISVAGGAVAATHNNVFWSKPYATVGASMTTYDGLLFSDATQNVFFGSYFSNFSNTTPWDTWNGFVLSSNYNNTATTMDITADQFSVWAAGGANGTKTFAAAYYGEPAFSGTYGTPTIEFAEPRIVKSLYIANSTVSYTYKSSLPKPNSYSVMITGEHSGDVGDKTTRVTLVDPSDNFKLSDWKKIDLSSWGKVDKIVFTAVSSDSMTPTYFCIDEIELAPKE